MLLPALIMLRGLPGSGKTSLAELLSENGKYPVFSVDDYFTDALTGAYNFRYDENHLAYSRCIENTRIALSNKTEKVFVDNTFTLEWEMEPYKALALEFGYTLFTITVENRHGGNNIHEIPGEQIIKMAEKYKVCLY